MNDRSLVPKELSKFIGKRVVSHVPQLFDKKVGDRELDLVAQFHTFEFIWMREYYELLGGLNVSIRLIKEFSKEMKIFSASMSILLA